MAAAQGSEAGIVGNEWNTGKWQMGRRKIWIGMLEMVDWKIWESQLEQRKMAIGTQETVKLEQLLENTKNWHLECQKMGIGTLKNDNWRKRTFDVRVPDDALPDIEEPDRIVPGVLGHQVLYDHVGHPGITRLANLRPSPRRGEAPALVLSHYVDVGEPDVADATPETFFRIS